MYIIYEPNNDVGFQKTKVTVFQIDDRVSNYLLGDGTVVRAIKSSVSKKIIIAYIVLFDTTPPIEYNLGKNPAMVFPSFLSDLVAK